MNIPSTEKHQSLDNILPYDAIASDCILSVRKKRITAILELHVSILESEEIMQSRHDRLMGLINEFPDDTLVSIYYCKNYLRNQIPVLGKHKNDIVNYIEKKRVERLSKINASTHQCFMSITIPLEQEQEKKGGIELIERFTKEDDKNQENAILLEKIKKATKRLNLLIKGLSGAIGGGVFRLESAQIVQFLSILLNHGYLENFTELSGVLLSDIICSMNGITKPDNGGYCYYGGNYHAVYSLRAYGKESSLPESSSAAMNAIFHHHDISDIAFTIHHSISIPKREKTLNIAKMRRNYITVQSGLSKNLSFLAKTPEGIKPEELKENISHAISTVEGSSHRFANMTFNIHLWAEDLKTLEDKCSIFMAAVSQTYKLKREKYNIKSAFYSLFPGNEDLNVINVMLPTYNIADYMPIDMPRFCYTTDKSKNFLYYYTKEDQLTKIDLFDRRSDNWNAIFCGGSGSGKSFLMNDVLFQYAVYNPQIAIIDYGGAEAGSYRNFVINNNGTYLEINLDAKNFSINPFDGKLFTVDGSPSAWKMVSLMATIERMATDAQGNGLTPETRYFLQEEIKKYYKEHNNNANNECNITEFAEKYLRDNTAFKDQDVYKRLFAFIGTGENEGPYARFFAKSRDITNRDIVCFDLAGLKGHQSLKSVLIPALLDMVCNDILGSSEKDRKKLMVMDEAWADLKGGAMTDFMEEMFRTIRKLNGNISIITQRFSDILNSDIGGAILANTSYFWFVGNKHDADPLKYARASSSNGTINLSEYDIQTIINSQSKKDFFLLTPYFAGLLKLYPCDEFAMVATTDPDDKNILRKHMQKLGVQTVTPEVIESAKNDFKNR